jgi:penicillin-insensitive murein endopeptidase
MLQIKDIILFLIIFTLPQIMLCNGESHKYMKEDEIESEGPGKIVIRTDSKFEPLQRINQENELYMLPLPITKRYFPRIGNGAKGSISVNTITSGFLVNGKELPLKGKHHEVMEVQARRGTNFGTDELVRMIKKASKSVNKKYPGSTLYVGNISKGGGGDVPWSSSHNAGRDVDIAFYLLDRNGNQFPMKDLIKLDWKGISVEPEEVKGLYRFDLKRNWELIKYVITDEKIPVQWIFVARPLKRMLIEYAAKKKKEPKWIIEKASTVLAQPLDAKSHNDHFHMRLFCSADDILDGCKNLGTDHSWKPDPLEKYEERKSELLKMLKSRSSQVRADALFVLGKLKEADTVENIARLLDDSEIKVRKAALMSIIEIGEDHIASRIFDVLKKNNDPEIALLGCEALATINIPYAEKISIWINLLDDRRLFKYREEFYSEDFTFKEKAVHVLSYSDSKTSAGALIKAMKGESELMISMIHEALTKLTNQDAVAESGIIPSQEKNIKATPEKVTELWEEWWEKNRNKSRDAWIVAGFKKANYPVKKLDRKNIKIIREALKESGFLSYNAKSSIRKILGKVPENYFSPIVEKHNLFCHVTEQ